jgi:hypothetical protein
VGRRTWLPISLLTVIFFSRFSCTFRSRWTFFFYIRALNQESKLISFPFVIGYNGTCCPAWRSKSASVIAFLLFAHAKSLISLATHP